MAIGRDIDAFLKLLGEHAPSGSAGSLREVRRYASGGAKGVSGLQAALQMLTGRSGGELVKDLLKMFTGGNAARRGASPRQIQAAKQVLETAGYNVSNRGVVPPPLPGGRGRTSILAPPLPGQRRGSPRATPPGQLPPNSPPGAPPESPFPAPLGRPVPGRDFGGRGTPAPPLPGEAAPFGVEVLTPESSNVYGFSFIAESRTRGILYVTYKASVLRASSLTHQARGRRKGGQAQLRGQLGKTVTGARKNEPGPLYAYYDVPAAVYTQMRSASSKGKFVWDRLRVRGTIYGHQYQYKLVSGQVSIQDGVSGVYIPRKATRRGLQVRSVAVVGKGRRAFQSSTLAGSDFGSRGRGSILRGR